MLLGIDYDWGSCHKLLLLLLISDLCVLSSQYFLLLDNSWLDTSLNNWLLVLLMNHRLLECLDDLSLIVLLLNDFLELLMDDWL